MDAAKSKLLVPVVVILLLIIGVGGLVLSKNKQVVKPQDAQNNQQKTPEQETKSLIEEIQKLIDIPTDEQAISLTVTDAVKLQAQPFFKKAKNGDKVLYYPASRRAILYDPAAKRVLDIGILDISPVASGSATPSAKP